MNGFLAGLSGFTGAIAAIVAGAALHALLNGDWWAGAGLGLVAVCAAAHCFCCALCLDDRDPLDPSGFVDPLGCGGVDDE